MEIEIKCTSTTTLPFNDLHALQGGLKSRSRKDIELLKNSILEHGFLFPLFVWQSPENRTHIIAGHGRLQAIAELRAENYQIENIPVDYIQAHTLEDAKHILLHEVSAYGKLSPQSIIEFSAELIIDFSEMSFPSGEISFRKGTFIEPISPENNMEIEEDPEIPTVKCICPHCQNTNYYQKTDIEYVLKYKRYHKFTLSTTGVIDNTHIQD